MKKNITLNNLNDLIILIEKSNVEQETSKKQGLFKQVLKQTEIISNCQSLFNFYVSATKLKNEKIVYNAVQINNYLLLINNKDKFKAYKEKIALSLIEELFNLEDVKKQKEFFELLGVEQIKYLTDIVKDNLNELNKFNQTDYVFTYVTDNFFLYVRSFDKVIKVSLDSEIELIKEVKENESK